MSHAEDIFRATCLTPDPRPPSGRADLVPDTSAATHCSCSSGDRFRALHAYADDYYNRIPPNAP
jgi:hypothetical protein